MKDDDFELFLRDFIDYLNALEEALKQLKQQIAKLVGVAEERKAEAEAGEKSQVESWNPDKIKWEKSQGARGEFEKSEDVNNPEFKALLKDLAQHNGKLSRDGWFYWTYKNGSTVGRKLKSKVKA